MQKISLFYLFILQIESILGSCHDWPLPFLTKPTSKIFNILLICMNLYLHPKNQLILKDTVNFIVQRPDLLNLLWRNNSFKNHTIFPKYWICAGMQQIINIL